MVGENFLRSLKIDPATLRSYLALVGGSGGRLVLSLAYFVSVANGLTIADFGLFATASAVGVLLSRIAGFGYVSPLYRAATVKPRLVGAYAGALLVATALSLPVVALAGALFYVFVFAGEMSLLAFCLVVAAEVLFWRAVEVVVIVNNGLGRFARGAIAVVAGSAFRALAAVAFVLFGSGALEEWAAAYLLANAAALAFALLAFWPAGRLRFRPRLALARWRDSLSVAGAEITFYLQSELDKMLVLAIGGPQTAGLYAIVMRLVDLTGLPVRAATTMVVQKLMRAPAWLDSVRVRAGFEGAIALVSVAGLGALGLVLAVFPRLLGDNVAEAAPLVLLALLVPAFRNLVEYQSELLYGRGLTLVRVVILAGLALLKGALLIALLGAFADPETWIVGLNAVFAALWAASAAATYLALSAPGKIDRAGRFSPAPQPGE